MHENRPNRVPDETTKKIKEHISSIKGQRSHYSVNRSNRVYLPPELNITKLHGMFLEKHPDHPVSLAAYRSVFNNSFNISFGYPRSDTCSTCDEYKSSKADLDNRLLNVHGGDERAEILEKIRKLDTENDEHKRSADIFYQRKRQSRTNAQQSETHAAFCMDFQKNLPAPNLSTNDVYYKRQLTCITFNIHCLASRHSYFYAYDETTAKKGATDVCSILKYHIDHFIGESVETLDIFCDSCAGQNKNYTVLRYCHYLVNHAKRFKIIKLTFPIRGHSYMECDKDFGLINQKVPAETPKEWWEEIRASRKSPSAFNVIECNQDFFLDFGQFLKPMYKAKCPVATRPIRELWFDESQPQLIRHRNNWHGPCQTTAISSKVREITHNLTPAYDAPLPLTKEKFNDIQSLLRFCKEGARNFYAQLPHL